jgi:hypothetical protein
VLELIVHLLFIQPTGEVYTQQEQAETIQAVHDSAAFWGYAVDIVDTQLITTNVDVYNEPITMWSTLSVAEQNEVYVYAVDHSSSGALLFGYGGYAQDYYRLLVIVNGNAQDARIAHELGHVLYGLPDWYKIPGKCNAPDIMCDAEYAYRKNIKGCNTLAFLGTPCYTISLPLIITPQYGIANSAKVT